VKNIIKTSTKNQQKRRRNFTTNSEDEEETLIPYKSRGVSIKKIK